MSQNPSAAISKWIAGILALVGLITPTRTSSYNLRTHSSKKLKIDLRTLWLDTDKLEDYHYIISYWTKQTQPTNNTPWYIRGTSDPLAVVSSTITTQSCFILTPGTWTLVVNLFKVDTSTPAQTAMRYEGYLRTNIQVEALAQCDGLPDRYPNCNCPNTFQPKIFKIPLEINQTNQIELDFSPEAFSGLGQVENLMTGYLQLETVVEAGVSIFKPKSFFPLLVGGGELVDDYNFLSFSYHSTKAGFLFSSDSAGSTTSDKVYRRFNRLGFELLDQDSITFGEHQIFGGSDGSKGKTFCYGLNFHNRWNRDVFQQIESFSIDLKFSDKNDKSKNFYYRLTVSKFRSSPGGQGGISAGQPRFLKLFISFEHTFLNQNQLNQIYPEKSFTEAEDRLNAYNLDFCISHAYLNNGELRNMVVFRLTTQNGPESVFWTSEANLDTPASKLTLSESFRDPLKTANVEIFVKVNNPSTTTFHLNLERFEIYNGGYNALLVDPEYGFEKSTKLNFCHIELVGRKGKNICSRCFKGTFWDIQKGSCERCSIFRCGQCFDSTRCSSCGAVGPDGTIRRQAGNLGRCYSLAGAAGFSAAERASGWLKDFNLQGLATIGVPGNSFQTDPVANIAQTDGTYICRVPNCIACYSMVCDQCQEGYLLAVEPTSGQTKCLRSSSQDKSVFGTNMIAKSAFNLNYFVGRCAASISSCQTCFESSDRCDACPSSIPASELIYIEFRNSPKSRICESKNTPKLAQRGTTNPKTAPQVYKKCPVACVDCKENFKSCKSCAKGLFLAELSDANNNQLAAVAPNYAVNQPQSDSDETICLKYIPDGFGLNLRAETDQNGNTRVKQCSPNCKDCQADHQKCKACTTDYFLETTKNECTKCLEEGFWQNTEKRTCEKCFETCKSCKAGAQTDCLECIPDHLFTIENSCLEIPEGMKPLSIQEAIFVEKTTEVVLIFSEAIREPIFVFENSTEKIQNINKPGTTTPLITLELYGNQTTRAPSIPVNLTFVTFSQKRKNGLKIGLEIEEDVLNDAMIVIQFPDARYIATKSHLSRILTVNTTVEIRNIRLYRNPTQELLTKLFSQALAGSTNIAFLATTILSFSSIPILLKVFQMLDFLILLNVPHPRNLEKFIESVSVSGFDIIPNLFNFVDSDNCQIQKRRFVDEDFTCSILANAGSYLQFFLCVAIVWIVSKVILKFLAKRRKNREKLAIKENNGSPAGSKPRLSLLEKALLLILKTLDVAFWLDYFESIQLDLYLSCFISFSKLGDVESKSDGVIFLGFVISVVIFIISVFIILTLFVLIYQSKSIEAWRSPNLAKIHSKAMEVKSPAKKGSNKPEEKSDGQQDSTVVKDKIGPHSAIAGLQRARSKDYKFELLYEDYHQKHYYQIFFKPICMLREPLIAFFAVFFYDDPKIQVLGCCTVLFLLTAFTLYYRPFKERFSNWTWICNSALYLICCSLFAVLLFVYESTGKAFHYYGIGYPVIVAIVTLTAFNMILGLIESYKNLKEYYQKLSGKSEASGSEAAESAGNGFEKEDREKVGDSGLARHRSDGVDESNTGYKNAGGGGGLMRIESKSEGFEPRKRASFNDSVFLKLNPPDTDEVVKIDEVVGKEEISDEERASALRKKQKGNKVKDPSSVDELASERIRKAEVSLEEMAVKNALGGGKKKNQRVIEGTGDSEDENSSQKAGSKIKVLSSSRNVRDGARERKKSQRIHLNPKKQ